MKENDALLLDGMQRLLEAYGAARQVILETEQLLEVGIDLIRGGGSVVDQLREHPAGDRRQAIQDALAAVDAARHEHRLRLVRSCLEEGMRPAEIASGLGISRQRVDVYVQELKRIPPD